MKYVLIIGAKSELGLEIASLYARNNYNIYFPSLYLCTDNAAMIAYAGLERLKRKKTNSLKFTPKPRWPLDKDAIFLKGKRIDAK